MTCYYFTAAAITCYGIWLLITMPAERLGYAFNMLREDVRKMGGPG